MDLLDRAVTQGIAQQLLQPVRLRRELAGIIEWCQDAKGRHRHQIDRLQEERRDAVERLNRLYTAIEVGAADLKEATLRDRITELVRIRDRADTELGKISDRSGPAPFTGARIEAYGTSLGKRLSQGAVPVRRVAVRSIVDEVRVDGAEAESAGKKAKLLAELLSDGGTNPVPSFVLEWRPRRDSNTRPTV